jgi:GNAT superfamily N-acetyltransferase
MNSPTNLSSARTQGGLQVDRGAVNAGGVAYRWRATVDDAEVDALHADAFGETAATYQWRRSRPLSLGWVTASKEGRLVGFANVAWDGNSHAFLLDVAIAPDLQRSGIGSHVVARALEEALKGGCEWIHVDYEKHLSGFYATCGFTPTAAGLRRLT